MVDGTGLGVTLEQLPGVTDTSSIARSPLYDEPRTPSNVKRVWYGSKYKDVLVLFLTFLNVELYFQILFEHKY